MAERHLPVVLLSPDHRTFTAVRMHSGVRFSGRQRMHNGNGATNTADRARLLPNPCFCVCGGEKQSLLCEVDRQKRAKTRYLMPHVALNVWVASLGASGLRAEPHPTNLSFVCVYFSAGACWIGCIAVLDVQLGPTVYRSNMSRHTDGGAGELPAVRPTRPCVCAMRS